MSVEYLKGASSNVGGRGGIAIERAPVLYAPTSTAELNTAWLPDPTKLEDMQLGYREQFLTDKALEAVTADHLRRVFVGSLLIALAVGAGGFFLNYFAIDAYLGAGIAFILSLNAVLRARATPQRLLIYLAGPFLGITAVRYGGMLLQHRFIATLVFAGFTFLAYAVHGHKPFRFYRDWLYAHPRLKPETRRSPESIALRPNWPILLGLLAIAAVVPKFSPALAIVVTLAVSIGVTREWHPKRIYRRMREVFGHYLTYGYGSTEAPGVWYPSKLLEKRLVVTWFLVAFPFLTLAAGLHLFGPWDVFRGSIRAAYDQGDAVLSQLFDSSYSWIPVAVELAPDHPSMLYLFPLALALFWAVPFYALAAIFHRPLVAAEKLRNRIEAKDGSAIDDDGRPEWQWYVDRICTSDHVADNDFGQSFREAEHFFLGIEPHAQFPLLLHEDTVSEHCYIVGETGSGKTALGITPLLMQLIRGHRDKEGGTTPPPPIVVLDLKGDGALYETLKAESAARREAEGIADDDPRYAFKVFTPERGRASHYFNPFQSLESEARSDVQLCEVLLESLSLNHGEGYGRSYYSRKSRMLLYEAITLDRERPKDLEELYERLKRLGKRDDYARDTFELVATAHAISRYKKLATAGNLDDATAAINMRDVLEHRQVVYFWLPAAIESISVREIGKLALFCYLTAAIDRQRAGEEDRQAYLVIDEFQRLAGENFKVVLEQARSFGLSAILANQSVADLKGHDVDLRPTVQTNTRTKLYFGVTDVGDIQALSEASGSEIATIQAETQGWSPQGATGGMTWTQALKPRLTTNDILAVGDHPLELIVQVSRGAGYTQHAGLPHRVRTSYPLTWETYAARRRGGPALEPETPDQVVDDKGPRDHEEESAALMEEKLAEIASDVLQP